MNVINNRAQFMIMTLEEMQHFLDFPTKPKKIEYDEVKLEDIDSEVFNYSDSYDSLEPSSSFTLDTKQSEASEYNFLA